MAKATTYKPFIAKVVLGAKCKRCGRDFTKGHPKDPQQYCERCRKELNGKNM